MSKQWARQLCRRAGEMNPHRMSGSGELLWQQETEMGAIARLELPNWPRGLDQDHRAGRNRAVPQLPSILRSWNEEAVAVTEQLGQPKPRRSRVAAANGSRQHSG
jgi:hypothetical protein